MQHNIEAKLQTGFPLFLDQFKALLKKNMLLSWRNRGACSLQFISSLFFIFLLFCIQQAIKLHASAGTFERVLDPKEIVMPPIPPCEESNFIRIPCFDFVWSGNGNSEIARIVRRIRVNNPGRVIPSSKVKSFQTPQEVDLWLESEPKRCFGALHFVQRNSSVISYGIQANSITVPKRGKFEDQTSRLLIPLQIAAEREIARSLLGDPTFSWLVGLKEFPHPVIHSFSVIGIGGPTFFLAITMFGFVFQVGSLAAEKELHLCQAMSMMGLYESAYWLSWLAWETLLNIFSSLLLILFGMVFQFNFFLHNSFRVIFLVFFLFQLNMVGFAFMISTFISKSSSSTTVGFAIYIIGFLTQIATTLGFPYRWDCSQIYRVLWAFFPPNLLTEAVKQLGDATSTSEDQGIGWSSLSKCAQGGSRCLPLASIFKWLITTFFLWFFLAIYLDNIFPGTYGLRKSFFYILRPSYWTGKGGKTLKTVEGGLCGCRSEFPTLSDEDIDDEDVLAEETIIREQLTHGQVDPNIAVQICGLTKTYLGRKGINSCYKCQKPCPYQAIERIWVNFAKDQLFCLLGCNGAGKTTLINCLTGIKTVTAGDALIYGYSIRSSAEMSCIQKMIGVCPQFDILWNALSAQEHLDLYASIKGLPSASIKSAVERTLSEVKLTNAADIRAGSYSGGMKRRLSVAIALIGDPKLVFLDEPTTGLDPITRRHVWDIIENAKKGRAIVLTTHSMEEADILSDRIAIMARGKLRCIGTSVRLKSRFGTGYVASVTFNESSPRQGPDYNVNTTQSEPQPELVKHFFKFHLDVVPKDENKAFLTFIIPRGKEELLTGFFSELKYKEKEFGISDIQLGLTSLEEVFLNISKKAEQDNHFTEEV